MGETTAKSQIIVLDDDPMICKIVQGATGIQAISFSSTKQMTEYSEDINPIAFFVDIHLDDQENGLDSLPNLKEKWPFCPVIVITSDHDSNRIGDALASGADDFIYKPLDPRELLARMQARMDGLAKREAKEISYIGDLVVDKSHRSITNKNDAKQHYLSPTEMNLLNCLLSAKGTIVRRESLKRRCWGQVLVSDNALNRKLHEVRRALKTVSSTVEIRTVYGSGFVLETRE